VLRFASGFHPTRPHGKDRGCQKPTSASCSCLRLMVTSNGFHKGLAPSVIHPCLTHLGSSASLLVGEIPGRAFPSRGFFVPRMRVAVAACGSMANIGPRNQEPVTGCGGYVTGQRIALSRRQERGGRQQSMPNTHPPRRAAVPIVEDPRLWGILESPFPRPTSNYCICIKSRPASFVPRKQGNLAAIPDENPLRYCTGPIRRWQPKNRHEPHLAPPSDANRSPVLLKRVAVAG